MQLEILRQVLTLDQALVHADRPLGFATPTKQATQRKMQFNRLRINLDGIHKRLDRPIRLLVK